MVVERQRGLTSLRQIHWQTGEDTGIVFDDPTYVTRLAFNPSPETSKLRYGNGSITKPKPSCLNSIWKLANGEFSSKAQSAIST